MVAGRYTLDPRAKVLLADLGVSVPNVLRRAGLAGDLFARTPVTLSSGEFRLFWEGLEAESTDPALPLRISQALTAEAFSPPIFAALCSTNLEQAARRLGVYKALIGPMRLDLQADGDGFTVVCRWLDGEPPPAYALTEVLFWVALARIGTRSPVRPTAITTTEPPTDQAPYVDALGVSIDPGPTHAISFSVADAHRPFLTASDALWGQFEPSLRTRLAEIDAGASTEERVRAALVELLPAGQTTMRDVGRSLAMSTRTLQRRLGEEGTSFQVVLASTREALARHYLADATISTAEISFLLGYAEPSSFYRAFHDWTGVTPERARIGVA